ncbi:hypothetical protein JWG42_01800 [Desulfoprunum benzoelyticum]|uniref:Putative membrane protein n=1 Tax=Desulfoprunum benzoelyticum TaxID=1506996 RepID=A0A840UP33_9BACT|nr:hypothetical protein [Desulfoprunum benzoelyticum]MBB5346586.1 putative membrane protein [Desulfoprunum benzoelyticum]MBM9528885.1 hypothetical protein [Desulfoprunum benzoelyticum]
MGNLFGQFRRHWFIVVVCLAACAAFYAFFINRAHVDLIINVDKRTTFKIYWAEAGEHFSEKKMAQVLVKPERQKYSFFLTDLKNIASLRIDPQEYVGRSTIEEIRIEQNGLQDIVLTSSEDFARLKPLDQIEGHSTAQDTLVTVSSGRDPNFSLEVRAVAEPFDWGSVVVGWVFIGTIILLVYGATHHLGFAFRYVPVLLMAVLLYAATMALISERNVHPDEYVHIAAARYYQEHWLPPAIGDPAVVETYSIYGVSRLNSNEISYLFCGRIAKIVAPFQLPEHLASRVLNLLLLGLILLFTLRVPDSRLVALPLLLSPQVWYLFSYCNSDAFALTVAFFAGCQVVVRTSALNRFLLMRQGARRWGYLLVAAVVFGLLFLLKKNFLVYTVFLLWVILVTIWRQTDKEERLARVRRMVAVCLVGLSLLAVKIAADYQVNGLDRREKILEMRDKLAHPLYNRHTPLEKQHANLYMKERGITLARIIHQDRWFEKTFRSAFGVYGYSTISAGFVYYDLVRWTGLTFLALVLVSLLVRAGIYVNLQTLAAVGLAAALIAVALYHSWTKDFQPQGRYLIPILPMLGVLCVQGKEYLSARIMTFFTLCMFLLSSYSFVCLGLLEIPRLLRI